MLLSIVLGSLSSFASALSTFWLCVQACANGPVILYVSDVDETACGTSERFHAFLESWGDQYGPISTEQLLQQGERGHSCRLHHSVVGTEKAACLHVRSFSQRCWLILDLSCEPFFIDAYWLVFADDDWGPLLIVAASRVGEEDIVEGNGKDLSALGVLKEDTFLQRAAAALGEEPCLMLGCNIFWPILRYLGARGMMTIGRCYVPR